MSSGFVFVAVKVAQHIKRVHLLWLELQTWDTSQSEGRWEKKEQIEQAKYEDPKYGQDKHQKNENEQNQGQQA